MYGIRSYKHVNKQLLIFREWRSFVEKNRHNASPKHEFGSVLEIILKRKIVYITTTDNLFGVGHAYNSGHGLGKITYRLYVILMYRN